MDIRDLLFDCDGVIVSTEINHFVAWKKIAESLGISLSESDYEFLKGLSRPDLLKKILEIGDKSISPDRFDSLLMLKNNLYFESIQGLTQADLLPGILDLVTKAKRCGLKLGVGSSSKNAKYLLNLLAIDHFFDIIIDGNDVNFPKPNPEVFLKGARGLGLDPNQCIVFEDAISGIQAAKDGGFYAVGVGNVHLSQIADKYHNDLTEFSLERYL